MLCTAQHRVNIQQVVSTHPTLSTAQTLSDLILTRAVQASSAVGRLGSLMLSTNITTIQVHTVQGLLHILLVHTLIIAKVVTQWLQIPHTPLGSHSIPVPRLMYGLTLVHMHPHSNSGSQASNLHKTTMGILFVQPILLHGQELELVLHHPTNLRTNSTNVPHKWDLNPGQLHLQIPPVENLQKLVHLPKCTTKPGKVSLILHKVSPRPQTRLRLQRQVSRLDLSS